MIQDRRGFVVVSLVCATGLSHAAVSGCSGGDATGSSDGGVSDAGPGADAADATGRDAATADGALAAVPDGAPGDAGTISIDSGGDAGSCSISAIDFGAPVDASVSAANITQVTTRSGNDFIDWGQTAASLTTFPTPRCVTSNGGLSAAIVNPTGKAFADQQGNPWAGNFAPADRLLCSGQLTTTAPITIVFASPVSGVGAQMGSDLISSAAVPFIENMVLFGTSGQILATFTAAGVMDTAADNSAVYIGAVDTSAEIQAVQFFISGSSNGLNDAYCLNRLSLQH